jgi:hypothetical protein
MERGWGRAGCIGRCDGELTGSPPILAPFAALLGRECGVSGAQSLAKGRTFCGGYDIRPKNRGKRF